MSIREWAGMVVCAVLVVTGVNVAADHFWPKPHVLNQVIQKYAAEPGFTGVIIKCTKADDGWQCDVDRAFTSWKETIK